MIKLRKRTLYRSPPASGDDLAEAADLEARAANQGPVHVGFGDEFSNIVRFDAPAVDHVAAVGRVAPKPLPQTPADVRMRVTCLCRRRVPAGSDGPHRLVCDDDVRDLLGGHAVEA